MRLVKRWYFWLGLVLLLGLTGSAVLIYANPSRITQENYDRIERGMSFEEVVSILGPETGRRRGPAGKGIGNYADWIDGPNDITVLFGDDWTMDSKRGSFASSWETLQWYAKKGAAKIGVKWD
jgi:hypothetical protein